MKINKLTERRLYRIVCSALITALLLPVMTVSAIIPENPAHIDTGWNDTGDIYVNISTANGHTAISPYIYGLNADGSLSGVTVNSTKQTGSFLSSYNWESNFANVRYSTYNANESSFIKGYSVNSFSAPALFTESLVTKAKRYGIKSRYVTLQMMGYAAKDNNGTVFTDKVEDCFNQVVFNKDDTYLAIPDTDDGVVYMDEYVSYLVNKYGYASDGGINGYFLDYEPDKWIENYPLLKLPQLTAESLVEKSAELAGSVKKIDRSALVYGPSLSGLEGYVNLSNPDDFESYSYNYSWFIDYYLDKMSAASNEAGIRLLDVLDLHFITEANDSLMEHVVDSNTVFSNAERMQAVRMLWDSSYTENSVSAIKHKQHTPVIPTVQASIRMYYPNTKLSFSEYNFGGGNHISGAIAEADALGVFAKQNVYMACLLPNSSDYPYQKSAINMYTDYDGDGASFGNTLVKADNGKDYMSSVYAAINDKNEDTLNVILINKNSYLEKNASVKIDSSIIFDRAEVYAINSESYEIRNIGLVEITDNEFKYEMEPLSIYLFDFKSDGIIHDEPVFPEIDDEKVTTVPQYEHVEHSDETFTVSSKSEGDVTAVTTQRTVIEIVGTDSNGETVTEVLTATEIQTDESENSGITEKTDSVKDNEEEKGMPLAFKVLVCILLVGVFVGIIYILISDRIKVSKK